MEEKKISIFRSLTAKMFYYMAVLTIIVISGTSYQNHSAFSKFLAEHASSELVSRAEMSMSQIENQLENWKAQAGTVVPSYSGDKKVYGETLSRLVDSNSDFIAIQVFSGSKDGKNLELIADGRTKKIDDVRFEDKVGTTVLSQSLTESQRLLPQKAKLLKGNKNTAVHSLAVKTKLPIMLFVTVYELPDSPDVLWSVLITWQSSLVKNLPRSNFLESAIIDSKGDIFSSNNLLLMTTKNRFSGEKITLAATSARKLSAAVEEYQSSKGKNVVGGYARSPAYGLAVLVEEDFDRAYAEMNINRLRTILWSMLFILIAGMLAYVGSHGTLKNIAEVQLAVRRIAKGNFEDSVIINANDELSALAGDINKMSYDIPVLMKADTTRTLAELDLITTKTVQSSFFPKKNILSKNLRVSGFYQPSSKGGGDLWGHYELQDDFHLLFVADAMGVGVPAALATAITYSIAATISALAADKNTELRRPSDLLRIVNGIVWSAFQGSMSLTFFCAIIDTKNGKMTYANAGHNFPFIIPTQARDPRGFKKSRPGTENKPQPFSVKLMGNPLGMQKLANFMEKDIAIEPGDKIFLFSDGLIECSSPQGEVWGRKHLFNQLSDITTLPFDEFKDEILSRAFSFFANNPLEDDVTVVVAEIPKAWKSQRAPDKISRRPDVPLPIPSGIAVSIPMTSPAMVVPEPVPAAISVVAELELPIPPFVEVAIDNMETDIADTIPEFSILEVTTDAAASPSHIVEMMENEISVLRKVLGIGQEDDKEGTIPTISEYVVEETTNETPVFLEISQEQIEIDSTYEAALALDAGLPLELDNSVQEIISANLSVMPETPKEALLPEKKAPKGKYKVRLPRTG